MNSGRSCASQPTTASSTTVTAIAGPRKPLPKTTTVVPTRTAVAISQPIPVDSTRCGSGGASPVGRRRIGWRGGSGVRRSASTTAGDRAGSMSALIPIKNADPLLRTPSLVGRQPEWQKLRPSWHVTRGAWLRDWAGYRSVRAVREAPSHPLGEPCSRKPPPLNRFSGGGRNRPFWWRSAPPQQGGTWLSCCLPLRFLHKQMVDRNVRSVTQWLRVGC